MGKAFSSLLDLVLFSHRPKYVLTWKFSTRCTSYCSSTVCPEQQKLILDTILQFFTLCWVSHRDGAARGVPSCRWCLGWCRASATSCSTTFHSSWRTPQALPLQKSINSCFRKLEKHHFFQPLANTNAHFFLIITIIFLPVITRTRRTMTTMTMMRIREFPSSGMGARSTNTVNFCSTSRELPELILKGANVFLR